jgi:hypothetical protein
MALHLGGEGEPTVEDQPGEQGQRPGEGDDEGGDHAGLAVDPARAAPDPDPHPVTPR